MRKAYRGPRTLQDSHTRGSPNLNAQLDSEGRSDYRRGSMGAPDGGCPWLGAGPGFLWNLFLEL